MTIDEALRIDDNLPVFEAEILLAHVIGKKREWLLTHYDQNLSETDVQKFNELVQRRLQHEPVSYITGRKEFYGREFTVTPDTLIPRPSTEELIDTVKEYLEQPADRDRRADAQITVFSRIIKTVQPQCIVDVGTGSGCIAVTLALETGLPVLATDSSAAALKIARQNAVEHGVLPQINFAQGHDLEPASNFSRFFLLVSNPPYIPKDEPLQPDVADFEPHSALFSGSDGSDMVKRLIRAAWQHPYCCGLIIEARDSHQSCFSK